MTVEGPALGGQAARALGLGDPDVAEDRGIDGSTSVVWYSNRCMLYMLVGCVGGALCPGGLMRLRGHVFRLMILIAFV